MEQNSALRSILSQAEWNLRRMRKTLPIVCIGMGVLELLLMLQQNGHSYQQLSLVLTANGAFLAYPAALFLVCGLHCWKSLKTTFRPRALYTAMTLPQPRITIFASRVLSSVVCALCVAAAQLVWMIVLYGPVTRCYAAVDETWAGALLAPFVENGLWLNLVRSPLLHMLLPLNGLTFFVNLICVLSMVSAAEALALVRRWWAAVLLAVSVGYAGIWYFARFGNMGCAWSTAPEEHWMVLAIEAACLAAAWGSALFVLWRGRDY